MNDARETYVPFPVPSRFVPQVTTYVADLLHREAGHSTPAVDTATPGDAGATEMTAGTGRPTRGEGVVWEPEMFERLASDGKLISQQRIVRILGNLPVGEENAMPLGDCAKAAGLTEHEFRHALGWLTRFTHKNKDLWPESTWPLAWKYGEDPDQPFVFYYWLRPEQSEVWKGAGLS